MEKNNKQISIFEGRKIRRFWDEKQEKWYFSVVDIIAILTNQPEHKKVQSYWTTLKNRLKEEGSEVVTKCDQLKWWKEMTRWHENIVGLDASILMSPKIWQASGHLSTGFADLLVECKKCLRRKGYRVDG
ncbi:hypothetical protein KKA77_02420 [Patescibacteria group bacterium]|nr:hypothetical protein [Patescibacteria group bacterium]